MPNLSKVLNTVGKTIYLAKSNAYQIPRKPPLNTLIFEKLPEPQCIDKISIKGPLVTKPVRICTKEDLQAFYCPPVPCDCKIKPEPLTFFQKIGVLFKETIKLLMVGGIIYYTYNEGLWSDAFRSSCFLEKFIEKCPKETDEFNEFQDISKIGLEELEPCLPFIPHTGFILYKIGYLWNQIIIFAFWFALDAPGEMLEAFCSLFRRKPKPKVPSQCPE